MERQLSQQSLGKAYREFSRQKYNKYRHQFPSMRESQVVVKIIRQWQRMPMEDKIHLNERFSMAKCYEEDDAKKLMSTNTKSEFTPHKDGSQKKHESAVKIYPTKTQYKVMDDDSNFNRGSIKMQENKQERQSSSYLVVRARQKDQGQLSAHKRSKNYHYIKFYKVEYERQTKQHPTWDSFKISQIIKLLWANKVQNDKITKRLIKKKMICRTRTIKKISGRQFFSQMKMKKGYSMKEVSSNWKKLTHQNKVMFSLKGNGQNDYVSRKIFRKDIINLKINQQKWEPSNYMFKKIQ